MPRKTSRRKRTRMVGVEQRRGRRTKESTINEHNKGEERREER